jgi:microcystin-dependent protein
MESYLGTIILFAGTFAPQGWALCDGRVMSIATNTALFSILGTQYGGDGKNTFALPKLTPLECAPGSAPEVAINYIICIAGIYPMRD